MSSFLVLVIQLAIAYWVYADAKKIGLPQMRILMWSLGVVVIPLPVSLLIVAAYYFIGRKGAKSVQDGKTIDVKAEVLPDETSGMGSDDKKAVVYCKMCGAEIPTGQCACPKCNTIVN